jgi:DNA-binding CsgD family transcriptional regulator
MNTHAIVARLNDLDRQLSDTFGTSRSPEATTLDEAITMAAATTAQLLGEAGRVGGAGASAVYGPLTEFLSAQIDARTLRDEADGNVVRLVTLGIRRMKKAGSLQGLGRQACTELCDALGFKHALLSFIDDDGFVVEESDRGLRDSAMVRRPGSIAEQHCIRLRDTIRTDDGGTPPTPGYQELLGCTHYLVAPVIAASHVVALLHVSCDGASHSTHDIDLLDTFASAYSLLHERMLNTERVQRQRTSIARAATRLTEEADRIAASAISLDVEYDDRVEPPTIAPDSTLAAALSDRERQVFERLVLGASNAEIADELVITVETVKTHVKRILRKIGAINRSEAIALYMEARTVSQQYSG